MHQFVQIVMWSLWGLTLFGLYRPWLALWWSDYCPRIKVLETYGVLAIIFTCLHLFIHFFA
ncbi:hypothetical protein PZB74_05875 [Porifericola rhodea]|uniref:hypothetical protein n=1 Tax=Porifericola rhodea TaxID=930972 RepID=UPI002664E5BE|nr:hypothetical protein [Porifericola rhodea]WKN32871.1 hypothetical protein PZB74_05875 [Porifericola rhodea]